MIRAADEQPFAEPICHIDYRELTRDPAGTMEKLYAHFGLALKPKAASRMEALVQASPNGGYGVNQYRFDTYQIDPAVARKRFAGYIARFQVAAEDRLRPGEHRGIPAPYSKSLTPEPAD